MRILIFVLAALALATSVASDAHGQKQRGDRHGNLGFKTGEAFPDIVLPNVENGKPMSLADFRGKKLLVLHFASW
ncbi:MAG: hypothetical protein ACI97A_001216 [Planctomycetota bacterium]|jgi:hypothetical protein